MFVMTVKMVVPTSGSLEDKAGVVSFWSMCEKKYMIRLCQGDNLMAVGSEHLHWCHYGARALYCKAVPEHIKRGLGSDHMWNFKINRPVFLVPEQ
jgi:hypothetical protein